MKRAAAFSLSLGLIACDAQPVAPSVAENEAARLAAVRTLSGWDRVFASPLETVGSINQAGFGLPEYASARLGQGFVAQGIDRLMSRSIAPSPNMGTASVAGSAPDRIDRISYVLKLGDPVDAATARDRFATAIGEFLGRAKIVGGEPLLTAVRAGRSAQPNVAGLKPIVAATPTRIDVTFARPAATPVR